MIRLRHGSVLTAAVLLLLAACGGGSAAGPTAAEPSAAAEGSPSALATAAATASQLSPTAMPSATPPASAAPASPPTSAIASATFKTGKAAIKVTSSGAVLSLDEPLGSGEVGGNRLSASWDDRAKGGGLIGSQLKIELPAASGKYANASGFEGVFITIKHLAISSETGDEGSSQSCQVVIAPTSAGGIAGTLDCTGTSPTLGSYEVHGTFSAKP